MNRARFAIRKFDMNVRVRGAIDFTSKQIAPKSKDDTER